MAILLKSVETRYDASGYKHNPKMADINRHRDHATVSVDVTSDGNDIRAIELEMVIDECKIAIDDCGDISLIAFQMLGEEKTALRNKVSTSAASIGGDIMRLLSIPSEFNAEAQAHFILNHFVSGVSSYIVLCNILSRDKLPKAILPIQVQLPFTSPDIDLILTQNMFDYLKFPLKAISDCATVVHPAMLNMVSNVLEWINVWGAYFSMGPSTAKESSIVDTVSAVTHVLLGEMAIHRDEMMRTLEIEKSKCVGEMKKVCRALVKSPEPSRDVTTLLESVLKRLLALETKVDAIMCNLAPSR